MYLVHLVSMSAKTFRYTFIYGDIVFISKKMDFEWRDYYFDIVAHKVNMKGIDLLSF